MSLQEGENLRVRKEEGWRGNEYEGTSCVPRVIPRRERHIQTSSLSGVVFPFEEVSGVLRGVGEGVPVVGRGLRKESFPYSSLKASSVCPCASLPDWVSWCRYFVRARAAREGHGSERIDFGRRQGEASPHLGRTAVPLIPVSSVFHFHKTSELRPVRCQWGVRVRGRKK